MELLPIIPTTDNNHNNPYILSETEVNAHLKNLEWLSAKPIGELTVEENPNLLVFPQCLNEYKDGSSSQYIFTLRGNSIHTGNIMGFVGYKNTRIRIHSRFAKSDKQDFFLHYMLQKVFAVNLFDLKYTSDRDSIFDFLIYLFPAFLKRALRQGLYREYQTKHYNDSHVRGRIDIGRHIRQNIPFTGRIAYSTREYSADNAVTQLIRHTIDFIAHHPYCGNILQNDEETKRGISSIYEATNNTYNRQDRQRVINANLRPLNHPYFSEYKQLQQLCLRILRHEELKYGTSNRDKIYGILFDGAWLWEEYLATVIESTKLMKHCVRGKNTQYLFTNPLSQPIVPDFLNIEKKLVGDAKYIPLDSKHISSESESALAIYYKTVMYMYRFNCPTGYLFYPYSNGSDQKIDELTINNEQKDRLFKIGMPIPQDYIGWDDFKERMNQYEKYLLKEIYNKAHRVL